jgi:hypothetical protein
MMTVVISHDSSMPYDLRWNNPRYWHKRAEEARIIAETMRNIEARAGMLRLATDYEVMAQRAEEWSRQTNSALGEGEEAKQVGRSRKS